MPTIISRMVMAPAMGMEMDSASAPAVTSTSRISSVA
jgi:hypothetical protein